MQERILEALNWRYAVREFDSAKKLSEADLNILLEAARLAPSSFGLQPWKFALVENKEKREAIQAAGWNQTQITGASHLLVVLAKDDMDTAYIEAYVKAISDTRGVPVEMLKGFQDMMVGSVGSRSVEDKKSWMARQAYIPVGMVLETAALLHVDAVPMEGFDQGVVKQILNIDGFTPYVLICLGYRSENDKGAGYKKVRMSADDAIVRM